MRVDIGSFRNCLDCLPLVEVRKQDKIKTVTRSDVMEDGRVESNRNLSLH